MQYNLQEVLDHCPPSDYCEFILSPNEEAAEAAYYLLSTRLSQALSLVYGNYGFGLMDDYNDTIDDFFLYLYGDDNTSPQPPFAMLNTIRDRRAFFAWVLGTYRNFLLKKTKETERMKSGIIQAMLRNGEEERTIDEETMCVFIANAIAFADQESSSLKRFIFFRIILSFLDHRQAIPQEQVAQVLDLNAVTYRVYSKRQKDRFMKYIHLQESGALLELNTDHLSMRDTILANFDRLYDVLKGYYANAIEALPNAAAVIRLRNEYRRSHGMLMHETIMEYGNMTLHDPIKFYEKLKAFLNRQWG